MRFSSDRTAGGAGDTRDVNDGEEAAASAGVNSFPGVVGTAEDGSTFTFTFS